MTAKQKFQAEEKRQELFTAAGWCCVVCNGSLALYQTPQLAHRVPKHRSMLERWGPEVINSPLNMVPVCSLKCNDRVSLGTVKAQTKDLLERIVRVNTGRESMPDMAEFYRELRDEFRKRQNP